MFFSDIKKNSGAKILLAILLIIVFVVIYAEQYIRYEQKRFELANLSAIYSGHISTQIHQSLSSAQLLGAYIKTQDGSLDGFETMASELLSYYPHVTSFQVAPNGVIKHILPFLRNKELIGTDLFLDPIIAPSAKVAQEDRELTLLGPISLDDGRTVVMGLLPIFLENDYEGSQFWGFVIATIRFPEVLENIDLSALREQGVAYRLTHESPFIKEKTKILDETQNAWLTHGVENLILLHGTTWDLELFPIKRNGDIFRPIFEAIIGVILVYLLTAWIHSMYQRRRTQFLETLAFFDPLTKLPNRTRLFDYYETFLHDTKHSDKQLLVGFIDLDRFKQVNDVHGHKIGDLLLLEVVERLGSCMHENDMLSRHGGDEFIFLWAISSSLEIDERLTHLLQLFNKPFEIEGETLRIGASIGVSLYEGETDLDALIAEADMAMYQAKMAGRGRYCIYTSEEMDACISKEILHHERVK